MTDEKRKVRTTLRPHEEIEVTEAEYTDLSRQGLIREGKPERKPAGKDETK